MLSGIRQLAVRRAGFAPGSQAAGNVARRSYVNEGATSKGGPGATNVRDSPSSSGEASGVNASRGLDGETRESKSTTARPVTNPEESGLGGQEEPQPSQEYMKRPKDEPDHIKRQHVEAEGQKPLDPADDGYGITSKK
ncbi:hypothetical protein CLAFUW4_03446 [Fulvia fulva]|uniref:Uncharacterized protein n=1 Tax=Passalora fulva TaxID=5499 RepID=A0A9Q8LBX8_PASFU|nr:uncharacterized protein CLAFUR5_03425 [Fulvia fulva]KAK4631488.1 hypothetical protein CLAFUR4_03435 [Fulvia fulva]KAK4633715.1 hypothetical protein CLAFUR0_03440 [Fulvia fulva]UJO14561.1 hypothetical protein CLAFUR5_03425 [Fulvia fulva]WPV11473.1 hypothetical protein CLAFUW4_03446 [Fulvia fulva]WPV25777.1 hypothetical protein CLAFUW7_03438 [Fulvia fulva]